MRNSLTSPSLAGEGGVAGGGGGRRSIKGTASAAASAAAVAADDGDKTGRTNSWYVDALRQQGGNPNDLEEILGASGTMEEHNAFGDDEVLEQYRIMAQHEASLRVKENTGFDMAEYEKGKKMQADEPDEKKGLYNGGKKLKARLPDFSQMTSCSGPPKPEEPPVPAVRLNPTLLQQNVPRAPELRPGVPVRGVSNIPHDEHVVRCLGCRSQLRVKISASLVSCPECGTVSPASSTRR